MSEEEEYKKTVNEIAFTNAAEKFNNDYIRIDAENSQIWIQIQDGPIQENGENGTQIDSIGQIWMELVSQFNTMNQGKFKCIENDKTIECIKEGLKWQHQRTRNRIKRGVEGLNKV